MHSRRFLYSILVLFSLTATAQVPTIINEIGELESVRDPKCYATASRLEDFIYGTPLENETRFEKIALQKQFIRTLWEKASAAVAAAGKQEVDVDTLRPVLQAAVPYKQLPDGSWVVRETPVTARDRRQYGTVAYALRAVLAVQQDALVDPSAKLLPLNADAVELFKESIDLTTLAALQRADRESRKLNHDRMQPEVLKTAWKHFFSGGQAILPVPSTGKIAGPPQGEKFATIKAIIAEKVSAFEAYNNLSMPVFLRNLQVYMARHMWPSDPEEGKAFRDQFTALMVAWMNDVLLEAEKEARKAGHALIRVEDVHAALQVYQPHEANQYEDIIYFPRLAKDERVIIEAYDLDSFRDPGLHWLYLSEAINDPKYKGTIEPDPFAAELLTEGAAQEGVLILRVAGMIAGEEERDRLGLADLKKSVQRIQSKLDKHASMPAPKKHAATIASAPSTSKKSDGKYFTDVTASSGIEFEHRLSDWLARFIRGYTVVEGNQVRLAVPPTFGGSGVAAEDIDNDGDMDILILSGAGNALYLNDGKGRFTDVTEASGLAWKRPDGRPGEPRQPIVADFDNDGLQDVLITYVNDAHRLYRNLGNAKFEDVTARTNLGGKGLVGGPATALDFDRDGLLDVYIGYFGDYLQGVLPTLSRRNSNAQPDKLFRNKGNFVFEEVVNAGVENTGWAQSVGHLDFDGDGWEDLICGNDFGTNAWYRNLGNGKFEDVSAKLGTDKPSYTMNIGITDLNRDGYPDVYISNIVTMDKDEKYVLPDTKTRMKFNPAKMANMRVVEANDMWTSVPTSGGQAILPVQYEQSKAVGRGFSSTGWSWGAQFFDYDNDGDDDLYLVNGMNEYAVYSSVNPYLTDPSGQPAQNAILPVAEKEVPVFFVNTNGMLQEETTKSGADPAGNARSVAYLDSDADGDLDMVVNNFSGPAIVYRNNSEKNGNHWIKLRLVGDPSKGVTRDAIGAKIIVDTRRQKGMWREVFSTIGYLSVHPKEQHVGLGADTKVDVSVLWPNGEKETFKGLAADKTYRIVQGQGVQ
ncbi:MAG TPA: CRTAC1 family protein [Thermoanaerobaculia bacterium]|nr:CRTAC1 family protein [Thermoanaerobaculia bacterium]